MQFFQTIKKNFFILIIFICIYSANTFSDISKAFPDMSNVFNEVGFYDANNSITKLTGYENKILLLFLVIHIVLMFVLQRFWIWQKL